MANIGSFKKSGNEYQGEIVTLIVQTKGVRIVPEANRSNDNAPSPRVLVGRAEIGAAWSKRSNGGRGSRPPHLGHPSVTGPNSGCSPRSFKCAGDRLRLASLSRLARRSCPNSPTSTSAVHPR